MYPKPWFLTEKTHAHLNQFFQLAHHTAAGYEQDDVVAVGQLHVLVPHKHFVAAHHGGNVAAVGPAHGAHAAADQLGRIFIAVCHDFDGLGIATAQGVDGFHVAAPDVRQNPHSWNG